MIVQDRPTVPELLDAIAGYLRQTVLARLEGGEQYHLRIAINLLAIIRREMDLGPRFLQEEWQSISGLLGEVPETMRQLPKKDLPATLLQQNGHLSRKIREGRFDEPPDAAALFSHLRTVTENRLRIANPKFLERVTETTGD